jgi:ribose transport system substrate-binding protein
MKMKRIFLAICLIALAGMAWAGGRSDQGGIRIALITMDSEDEHWLKLNTGAQEKAAALRASGTAVQVDWTAPAMGKTDPADQLRLLEDAITRRVDAIMIAPNHADALVPGIERARAAGIKIILVDSGANTDAYDSFLFTDNAVAAQLAADELAKLLNGRGQVAIVNAQPGAATLITRENEFRARMAANYPGITIVGVQYSDGDPQKALNQATDFMTANPNLAGFYACNEGATVGTGMAIEQRGVAGKIRFVGFDWSATTRGLVERGVLDASMVQNPFEMGFQGVQAAVDLIQGKTVERHVDTGVTVVTRDNASTIN